MHIKNYDEASDNNISRALGAFHSNPDTHWTLEELAAVAGMSRTAFTMRFSHLVAMTPWAYMNQWRMQIARQMLIDTMIPIVEVAENAGYQSEASFSRAFKKHFQSPPAKYRRIWQKAS